MWWKIVTGDEKINGICTYLLRRQHQPEAFASDLGDDQSRYLFTSIIDCICVCDMQLYEPIELERSHYTDFDQEVRVTDMPERFQLRTVPICPTEEGELDEEAEWIYRQAFSTPPISRSGLHAVSLDFVDINRGCM